jgi:predicted nucleotide-binding protein (sugar kinase/HSP70/actin superfamily)
MSEGEVVPMPKLRKVDVACVVVAEKECNPVQLYVPASLIEDVVHVGALPFPADVKNCPDEP